MPKLLQRIRKLEARLTDASRLVPHSIEWYAYWERIFTDWTDALLLNPSAGPAKPFPHGVALAIFDRIIADADAADAAENARVLGAQASVAYAAGCGTFGLDAVLPQN
jgi:hypothetical protein